MIEFITNFGDEAVILPLVLVVALGLGTIGWWRGCLAWTLVVGGVLATMGFLKVLFVACAAPLDGLGIASPSGHTAAATVAYGGLILLMCRGRLPNPLLVAAPLAIAVIIGTSRIVLGAHVPIEALVGGVVGLAGVAILVPLAGGRPPMNNWRVPVTVILIVIAFHGSRLQAEQTIYNFAYLSWLPLSSVCRMSG